MIFIQQFLPIHFYGNSTDKNLTLNFSLNRFLCGRGLNLKFKPNRFWKPRFLYAGLTSLRITCPCLHLCRWHSSILLIQTEKHGQSTGTISFSSIRSGWNEKVDVEWSSNSEWRLIRIFYHWHSIPTWKSQHWSCFCGRDAHYTFCSSTLSRCLVGFTMTYVYAYLEDLFICPTPSA